MDYGREATLRHLNSAMHALLNETRKKEAMIQVVKEIQHIMMVYNVDSIHWKEDPEIIISRTGTMD